MDTGFYVFKVQDHARPEEHLGFLEGHDLSLAAKQRGGLACLDS